MDDADAASGEQLKALLINYMARGSAEATPTPRTPLPGRVPLDGFRFE